MAQNITSQLNSLAEVFAQVDFLPKARKQKSGKSLLSLDFASVDCFVQNEPFQLFTGGCPSGYVFSLFVDCSTGLLSPGILGDFANHSAAGGVLRIVANLDSPTIYSYRFQNLLVTSQSKTLEATPDYEKFAQLPSQIPALNSLFVRYIDKSRIWSIQTGLTHEQHVELANISKQIREKLFSVSRGATEKKEVYLRAIQLTETVHTAHKAASKPANANTKQLEWQILAYIIMNWSSTDFDITNSKQIILNASTLPLKKVDHFRKFIEGYILLRSELNANGSFSAIDGGLNTQQQAWQLFILQAN